MEEWVPVGVRSGTSMVEKNQKMDSGPRVYERKDKRKVTTEYAELWKCRTRGGELHQRELEQKFECRGRRQPNEGSGHARQRLYR